MFIKTRFKTFWKEIFPRLLNNLLKEISKSEKNLNILLRNKKFKSYNISIFFNFPVNCVCLVDLEISQMAPRGIIENLKEITRSQKDHIFVNIKTLIFLYHIFSSVCLIFKMLVSKFENQRFKPSSCKDFRIIKLEFLSSNRLNEFNFGFESLLFIPS